MSGADLAHDLCLLIVPQHAVTTFDYIAGLLNRLDNRKRGLRAIYLLRCTCSEVNLSLHAIKSTAKKKKQLHIPWRRATNLRVFEPRLLTEQPNKLLPLRRHGRHTDTGSLSSAKRFTASKTTHLFPHSNAADDIGTRRLAIS